MTPATCSDGSNATADTSSPRAKPSTTASGASPKADDLFPSLVQLTRREFIRLRPAEANGPGRPPSPTYEVNPATFADANPEKRSHNSQNAIAEPAIDNSGNIGSAFKPCSSRRVLNCAAPGDTQRDTAQVLSGEDRTRTFRCFSNVFR